MAKRKAKAKKSAPKKAPSPAQLAARAAFAARFKSGGGSKNKAKSSKKAKPMKDREMEARTAKSKIIRDDSTSEYERAATIPVAVPKPVAISESGFKAAIPANAEAWYVEPIGGFGSRVKRQISTGTSFFS